MSTPVSPADAPAASSLPTARPGPLAPARALKLVVLVPCFDEVHTVGEVVRAVPRQLAGVASVEIVVLDDGSTDATAERAREAGAQVLSHRVNLGLGRTFRDGVRHALALGADLVVNIDGDGQFNPADIATLVAPIVAGEAHMATASRFLRRELVPRMPAIKRWGNRWVARIVWLLSGRRFRDVSCGFRAFSREALLRMNLFGSFTYTQETFLDLIFKGLEIVELPVQVEGVRRFGASRVASSIPRYAFRSLQIMLRAFISYRPFSFFAALAGLFLAIGLALLGFLLAHYLSSGAFSPHIWAGFVGGSFCFLGTSTLVIAVMGDMLVRQRLNQEEVLYFLKRDLYRRGAPGGGSESDAR
jgi:glycosyltransferase involved in cell wall biosynthesis